MAEESPNVEMLRSAKGKDMLLINNYLYHYDDRTSKPYRWVCSRRKDKVPCRVRLHTSLIDECDLTRHKVEKILGEHPHGPADPGAIIRAREKKKRADAEGLPCTLGNKTLKRIERKEEVNKINAKRIKMAIEENSYSDDDDGGNEANTTGENQDSDDDWGDLVKSLGIKTQSPKKVNKTAIGSDGDDDGGNEDNTKEENRITNDEWRELVQSLGLKPQSVKKLIQKPQPVQKKVLMLKTAKGHHMIAVEGCVYRLDGKSMLSSTFRWKCFRSKDLQCNGKIYTECLANGHHRFKPIRLEEIKHNHQPYSVPKIEALIRRNNIKVLHGKEAQSSLKVFDVLTSRQKKTPKPKVEKKPKSTSIPLSVSKGSGNVLSISFNINVTPSPKSRKQKAEATSKLYRYVEDVMDVLNNPKDGEITKYTFLPSLKGNRILIMESMIFHYDSRGSIYDRAYWTCLYRRDKIHKCNCRLTTEGLGTDLKIVKVSGDHKHTVDHREHIDRRLKRNLKTNDNLMEPQKMEQVSLDDLSQYIEEDDDVDNDHFDDDDDNHDTTHSRENSQTLRGFLQKKALRTENQEQPDTTQDIEDISQTITVEYQNEMEETDPFQSTYPVIEYVEMERANSTQYHSDSESEDEYKPRGTLSRGRKSAANNTDKDYVPPTKAGYKPQSMLKKQYSSTSKSSYNPDNIDITKITKLRSAKGGELLCVDGFIYHLKSISNNTRTYWACIKSKDRILKCPARVTSASNSLNQIKVIHLSNSHTHPISEDDIKKRLFNEFSKSSTNSDLKSKHIMEKSLCELNPEFAYLLGKHDVKKEKFK